jgi:N-acetylglucosaminylphosphatidylinositol deacetylase
MLLLILAAAVFAVAVALAVWPGTSQVTNAATLGRLANQLDAVGSSAGSAHVLVVFAHPDDEAMFFSPALAALREAGYSLHFLCFSSGNYAGLGATRTKELERSGRVYGAASVRVVEDGRSQDGPQPWDTSFVGSFVADYINTVATHVHVVLTFDDRGVSGHPNHVDVHKGIRSLAKAPANFGLTGRRCLFYELRTRSMPRKYSGPLEIISWWLDRHRYAGEVAKRLPAAAGVAANAGAGLPLRFAIRRRQALLSLDGMRAHPSQLVWFRYLFVFFSQYGFVNELHPMASAPPEQ